MSRDVRFFDDDLLSNETIEDIFIILDSNTPLISRLRIPDHVALANATVFCNTESGSVNATYMRNSYSKLNIAKYIS